MGKGLSGAVESFGERLARVEANVQTLERRLDSLDGRVWWVLITNLAAVSGIVALLLK